jgi:hypothetical protein
VARSSTFGFATDRAQAGPSVNGMAGGGQASGGQSWKNARRASSRERSGGNFVFLSAAKGGRRAGFGKAADETGLRGV